MEGPLSGLARCPSTSFLQASRRSATAHGGRHPEQWCPGVSVTTTNYRAFPGRPDARNRQHQRTSFTAARAEPRHQRRPARSSPFLLEYVTGRRGRHHGSRPRHHSSPSRTSAALARSRRIAGVAGNGVLDPGETWDSTNKIDTGLIGSFDPELARRRRHVQPAVHYDFLRRLRRHGHKSVYTSKLAFDPAPRPIKPSLSAVVARRGHQQADPGRPAAR